ncbi:GMC family oxidoreductase [Puniceibacterium sp. IMCC21224]|uniref:GMC family oxidoreductase n=1 Tax=Puniceibacterium sp. IMCC21224 TaxID=1618204 RepID=UPI00064DDCA6|nr:GMC family oxidoreductase N-terminal domain-containing protein [Puniceibacterium sp. IMCC21224]KMK64910.1 choline dehydrogenase-like flavoprotein [Puniceibacterium sp. IMCC21224]
MSRDIHADVIVVGSGSAGAVVAGRLAAETDAQVLLIEAGGRGRNPLFRVPLMTGILLRGRYANWYYHTEPEPGLDRRRLFWPRGKVLGGSSSINGMVWTRGLPSDYDGWAQRGLPGWGWDDVQARFLRIEGHQKLSDFPDINPLSQAFLDAGVQAGHPRTTDFNGPSPEGMGRYDFTIAGGRRLSAASAWLAPHRDRPNLRILTGAHALRVLVEGGRAVGLELAQGSARITARAASEVVLSCGTVNTPQLLMLSGIGPADHLNDHGIAVCHDLPGVGQGVQDHLLVRVEHDCTRPVTLHNLLRADRAALALGQAMLFGTGPAARFPLEAGAFLRSDPALDTPDLQAHFLPGRSTAAVRVPFRKATAQQGHGFFANIYQMRPESRGQIRLQSDDPKVPPAITGGYLTAPRDIAVLRAGVRRLREIFAQSAFDNWRGPEIRPSAGVQSDADLDTWIRANAESVFHPVGSCRMGNDALAVTDAALKVHGIDGLRIADASVMPTLTSNNTQAPTSMIGMHAADLVIAALDADTRKGVA